MLDANYLTAHLPLIDPAHPDAIAASPDGTYQSGRYEAQRFSLVVPVLFAKLQASPAFQRIDHAIRSSSFAHKIAWQVMACRQKLIHATLCGGLNGNDMAAIAQGLLAHLKRFGAPRYKLGGPLVGQKNTGRIYFPLYPEMREGKNAFHAIQDDLGLSRTDIYLAGYYNLSDHLDIRQTKELSDIIEQYGAAALFEGTAQEFWLLGTHDDLVLSGRIYHVVSGP